MSNLYPLPDGSIPPLSVDKYDANAYRQWLIDRVSKRKDHENE